MKQIDSPSVNETRRSMIPNLAGLLLLVIVIIGLWISSDRTARSLHEASERKQENERLKQEIVAGEKEISSLPNQVQGEIARRKTLMVSKAGAEARLAKLQSQNKKLEQQLKTTESLCARYHGKVNSTTSDLDFVASRGMLCMEALNLVPIANASSSGDFSNAEAAGFECNPVPARWEGAYECTDNHRVFIWRRGHGPNIPDTLLEGDYRAAELPVPVNKFPSIALKTGCATSHRQGFNNYAECW